MNQVTVFNGQRMAGAFATLNPQGDSLSEGIGSSYGIIGYKGKTWSLRYRGETHIFTRPDDGSPLSYIDVIVLRHGKTKSKSFYADYDPDNSAGKRPICSSLDGIKPDLDVQQKQADACALCPRNVWKQSPTTGRKERECTDFKRVAVLLLPSMTKTFFNGAPLIEPVFLRVPPASLQDLATFGDQMAAQGYHYASFVTRISFDPTVAHPKMQFRGVQLLTDQEAPTVFEQMESDVAKRITGEIGVPQGVLAAPAARPALAPAQNLGLTATTAAPVQTVAQPAVQPTPPAQPVHQEAPVSTGFLELQANPPAQQPAVTADGNGAGLAPQTLQTAADVGVADSNDELDAKLNAILPRP